MKNPLVYAYIGDSIYECFIRKFLINQGICKIKDLQQNSLNYVSAVSQRRILERLINNGILTPEEIDITKWGRNAKGSHSKGADIVTYRIATGFETLIGYLYYEEKMDRIKEIMAKVVAE